MPFITAYIKDRKSKGAMESDIKVLDVATVRVCERERGKFVVRVCATREVCGESVCATREVCGESVCAPTREGFLSCFVCLCMLSSAHTHARTHTHARAHTHTHTSGHRAVRVLCETELPGSEDGCARSLALLPR